MNSRKTARASFELNPLAKQSVRGGKRGFYTDPKYTEWQKRMLWQIKQKPKFREAKFHHAVRVWVNYYFAWPTRFPKYETVLGWGQKKQAKERVFITSSGVIHKVGKPDLHDNLNKLPIDTLTKAGILSDDSIIYEFSCTKQYSLEGDRIWIEITGQ